MKIAIASFNLEVPAGGNVLLFSMAQVLQRLGHKVSIFAPLVDRSIFPELQKDLDIRQVACKRGLDWGVNPPGLLARVRRKINQERLQVETARKMAAVLRSTKLDVLILGDFAYRVCRFYKKNARSSDIARVLWIMNEPPYQYLPKESLFYDFASHLYNIWKDLSARKYFYSIDGVAVLVNRYKAWADERGLRATVIRSGLDFKKFYSPLRDIRNKKKFEILSIGALNRYRRFEDTVRAAKILRGKGVDTRVRIIAKNIWRENEYQKELTDFVNQEKMSDFVELNFEGVSETELPKTYSAADFFVLPMHLPAPRSGYGWQMVGFEAMAAGRPTIICRTLDVSEVLVDGETAALVDPGKPEQIAAAIEKMMSSPDFYVRIAEKGQKFVRENLSWDKYAQELLSFSDEIGSKK